MGALVAVVILCVVALVVTAIITKRLPVAGTAATVPICPKNTAFNGVKCAALNPKGAIGAAGARPTCTNRHEGPAHNNTDYMCRKWARAGRCSSDNQAEVNYMMQYCEKGCAEAGEPVLCDLRPSAKVFDATSTKSTVGLSRCDAERWKHNLEILEVQEEHRQQQQAAAERARDSALADLEVAQAQHASALFKQIAARNAALQKIAKERLKAHVEEILAQQEEEVKCARLGGTYVNPTTVAATYVRVKQESDVFHNTVVNTAKQLNICSTDLPKGCPPNEAPTDADGTVVDEGPCATGLCLIGQPDQHASTACLSSNIQTLLGKNAKPLTQERNMRVFTGPQNSARARGFCPRSVDPNTNNQYCELASDAPCVLFGCFSPRVDINANHREFIENSPNIDADKNIEWWGTLAKTIDTTLEASSDCSLADLFSPDTGTAQSVCTFPNLISTQGTDGTNVYTVTLAGCRATCPPNSLNWKPGPRGDCAVFHQSTSAAWNYTFPDAPDPANPSIAVNSDRETVTVRVQQEEITLRVFSYMYGPDSKYSKMAACSALCAAAQPEAYNTHDNKGDPLTFLRQQHANDETKCISQCVNINENPPVIIDDDMRRWSRYTFSNGNCDLAVPNDVYAPHLTYDPSQTSCSLLDMPMYYTLPHNNYRAKDAPDFKQLVQQHVAKICSGQAAPGGLVVPLASQTGAAEPANPSTLQFLGITDELTSASNLRFDWRGRNSAVVMWTQFFNWLLRGDVVRGLPGRNPNETIPSLTYDNPEKTAPREHGNASDFQVKNGGPPLTAQWLLGDPSELRDILHKFDIDNNTFGRDNLAHSLFLPLHVSEALRPIAGVAPFESDSHRVEFATGLNDNMRRALRRYAQYKVWQAAPQSTMVDTVDQNLTPVTFDPRDFGKAATAAETTASWKTLFGGELLHAYQDQLNTLTESGVVPANGGNGYTNDDTWNLAASACPPWAIGVGSRNTANVYGEKIISRSGPGAPNTIMSFGEEFDRSILGGAVAGPSYHTGLFGLGTKHTTTVFPIATMNTPIYRQDERNGLYHSSLEQLLTGSTADQPEATRVISGIRAKDGSLFAKITTSIAFAGAGMIYSAYQSSRNALHNKTGGPSVTAQWLPVSTRYMLYAKSFYGNMQTSAPAPYLYVDDVDTFASDSCNAQVCPAATNEACPDKSGAGFCDTLTNAIIASSKDPMVSAGLLPPYADITQSSFGSADTTRIELMREMMGTAAVGMRAINDSALAEAFYTHQMQTVEASTAGYPFRTLPATQRPATSQWTPQGIAPGIDTNATLTPQNAAKASARLVNVPATPATMLWGLFTKTSEASPWTLYLCNYPAVKTIEDWNNFVLADCKKNNHPTNVALSAPALNNVQAALQQLTATTKATNALILANFDGKRLAPGVDFLDTSTDSVIQMK